MTSTSHKHEEIKHAVEKLFATKPDWMKFYREVMGLQGLIRRAFPSLGGDGRIRADRDLSRDPSHGGGTAQASPSQRTGAEDTKVITVRIPQSLHEALRIEAYRAPDHHEQTVYFQAGPVHRHGERADGFEKKRCEEEEKAEVGL